MLEAAAAAKTLQETIDSLHGKTIEIGIQAAGATGNVGDSAAGAAADVRDLAVAWTEEEVAQKAASAAAEAFGRDIAQASAEFESFMSDRLHASMENLANDLYIQANSADQADLAFEHLRQGYQEAFGAQDSMTRALDAYRVSLERVNVEETGLWDGITRLGPGFVVAADGADRAGAGAVAAAAGAAAANNSFRIWGTGIRLTGTALHWLIAGSAEFLAVAVPAAIALGAGLFVASQGAQNAWNHMNALYDTLEAVGPATHQTMGDVLGLGHAFQTAQDAANPGVYEILGSAINDAKTHFADLATAGLDVVHMFDEFSARVTVDLQGGLGKELGGLLSGMVTDLQEFGNVLGNLGHALLNFAADMPGLAHVLLAVATGLSEVIEWASRGGVFITLGMAIEETYRWGGLLLGLLARLAGAGSLMTAFADGGGFIARFGAAIKALVSQGGVAIMWAGQMTGKLSSLVPAAEEAGAAVETFGADVAIAGATMSTTWIAAITAAAVALVFLGAKLASVKSATDQFIASSDQMVRSASDMNVLNTIGKALAENSIHLAAAQTQAATATEQFNTAAARGKYAAAGYAGAAQQAEGAVQKLGQQQTFLAQTAAAVVTNAQALGEHFHTTAAGAIALAQAAGVNLQLPLAKSSEAMKIAEQQVQNLITGLGAMGAPAGMVGADMSAMGIQSQLAATKVAQLNQAWDAWIQSVTGGVDAMSQVQTALEGMDHAALNSSASVTGSLGNISRAAKGSSYDLQGFGQKAMQSWQQFSGAITSGNSAIDQLRTGMAEGVVSVSHFQSTVKGLVGEMAPFTEGNRTAVAMLSNLAQEAGGPATTNLKTLEQWAGVAGNTAKDQFAKGMLSASAAMSDMSKVAQNLSAVINSQLDSAMASAIAKTLNISGLTQTYTNDLARYGAQAPQTTTAQNALNSALQHAYSLGQEAASGLNATAGANHNVASSAGAAASALRGENEWLNSLHSKSITVTTTMITDMFTFHSTKGPMAAGGDVASSGFHLVGEQGPEIRWLNAGDHISNAQDTRRFLSNPGGYAGGGGAGGGSAFNGTINLTHTTHVHAQVDQSALFDAVKTETARYAVRNGNPQQGRLAPGKL